MCITEYNEKTFVDGIRKEGIEQGKNNMIFTYVQRGKSSIEEGAKDANMSIKDFKKAMTDAGYKLPGQEK